MNMQSEFSRQILIDFLSLEEQTLKLIKRRQTSENLTQTVTHRQSGL